MRATALVTKIQKTMNAELTLQDVFRLPTVKEQAQKIEGMSKTAYSAIEPSGTTGVVPSVFVAAAAVRAA